MAPPFLGLIIHDVPFPASHIPEGYRPPRSAAGALVRASRIVLPVGLWNPDATRAPAARDDGGPRYRAVSAEVVRLAGDSGGRTCLDVPDYRPHRKKKWGVFTLLFPFPWRVLKSAQTRPSYAHVERPLTPRSIERTVWLDSIGSRSICHSSS